MVLGRENFQHHQCGKYHRHPDANQNHPLPAALINQAQAGGVSLHVP